MKFVNDRDLPEWFLLGNRLKTEKIIPDNMSYVLGVTLHNFREFFKEAFKDNIPKFNYEYTSSRLTLGEYRQKLSTRLLVKPRPLVSFAMNVNKSFDGGMLSSYAHTMDLSSILNVRAFTSPVVICDDGTGSEKNLAISYSYQRMSTDIDTTVLLPGQMKAMNAWNYIRIAQPTGIPIEVPMIMEVPFDKKIVETYADIFDLKDENGKPDLFSIFKHMSSRALQQIDYKLNTSTGNNELFFKYPTVALITPQDCDFNDGEMNGNLAHNFSISRRYTLEINTPCIAYIHASVDRFIAPKDHKPEDKTGEMNNDGSMTITIPEYGYRLVNWNNKVVEEDEVYNPVNGKFEKITFLSLLEADVLFNKDDILDNTACFYETILNMNNGRYIDFLNYCIRNKFDIDEKLFRVYVYKYDTNELVDNTEFKFNYKTLELLTTLKTEIGVKVKYMINSTAFNKYVEYMTYENKHVFKYDSIDDLHLRVEKDSFIEPRKSQR